MLWWILGYVIAGFIAAFVTMACFEFDEDPFGTGLVFCGTTLMWPFVAVICGTGLAVGWLLSLVRR